MTAGDLTASGRRRKYKIFVSYRHVDSHAVARIVHFLEIVFGKDAIFHDDKSIPAGTDFRGALTHAVSDSEIVLAVIGPTWVESFRERVSQSQSNDTDWVLVELDHAFNESVRVIPVVLHPAVVPGQDQLPDSAIRELAFRQARIIWPGLAFDNSVHQLVDELQIILDPACVRRDSRHVAPHSPISSNGRSTSRKLPLWWLIGLSAALMIVAIVVILFVHARTLGFSVSEKVQIERRIASLRSTKPRPLQERALNAEDVPTLGAPDHSLFEILADESTWDLRGVKKRTRQDPLFTSYAISVRHVRVIKTGPAKELRFEFRTSGSEVFSECTSHPTLAREYVSQTPAYTGKREMKVRQLGIDVASLPIGSELDLILSATYWDSFQEDEDSGLAS